MSKHFILIVPISSIAPGQQSHLELVPTFRVRLMQATFVYLLNFDKHPPSA